MTLIAPTIRVFFYVFCVNVKKLHLSYTWLQLKLQLIWLIYALVTVVTVKEDFFYFFYHLLKKIKVKNLKKNKIYRYIVLSVTVTTVTAFIYATFSNFLTVT